MAEVRTRGLPLRAIDSALGLLTRRERARFWIVVAAQMATDVLDLAGVLLIAGIGILASSALGRRAEPTGIRTVLRTLGLGNMSLLDIAVWMAVAAAGFFLAKSVLYGYLISKNYSFLARAQSAASLRLLRGLLDRPISDIHRFSPQETVYAVTTGAAASITGLLGSVAIVLSDLFLLIMLASALFAFRPLEALSMVILFACVGWVMHCLLSRYASRTGAAMQQTDVRSMGRVQEGILAFRELWTLDRRETYVQSLTETFTASAHAQAKVQMISQIPKLVYDSALVIGAVMMASWQLRSGDAMNVVATLVIFLAAGSRLVPSMVRLSTQLVVIRTAAAQATRTNKLAALVSESLPSKWQTSQMMARAPTHAGVPMLANLEMNNVSFRYDGRGRPALSDISLRVPAGTSLAIVGRSGAGKSTLADVLIGVLAPDSGHVRIGGLAPWDAIRRWPGQIAYSPQNVALFRATIRENVALGLPPEAIRDEEVWEALHLAHADQFVRALPAGIYADIGERGSRLSGGQRQRIGLARSLMGKPSVLILDEATSALDAETEHAFGESIRELNGNVTTIVIAHRLGTVRTADAVAYLEEGRLLSFGSFEQVRGQVPSLEAQARLLGLV